MVVGRTLEGRQRLYLQSVDQLELRELTNSQPVTIKGSLMSERDSLVNTGRRIANGQAGGRTLEKQTVNICSVTIKNPVKSKVNEASANYEPEFYAPPPPKICNEDCSASTHHYHQKCLERIKLTIRFRQASIF